MNNPFPAPWAPTETIRVKNSMERNVVLIVLFTMSCTYLLTPFPDDEWAFTFKANEGVKERAEAALAEARAKPTMTILANVNTRDSHYWMSLFDGRTLKGGWKQVNPAMSEMHEDNTYDPYDGKANIHHSLNGALASIEWQRLSLGLEHMYDTFEDCLNHARKHKITVSEIVGTIAASGKMDAFPPMVNLERAIMLLYSLEGAETQNILNQIVAERE